jgi:hypothetical protein
MRFQICDTAVWVTRSADKYKVPGQRGLLLRLLLLWPQGHVSQELICAVLGIKRSGVGTYLRALRTDLGDRDLIKSEDGFVYLDPPPAERLDIDAYAFQHLVDEAFTKARGNTYVDMSLEIRNEVSDPLDQALSLWRGSPATGLDNVLSDVDRRELVDERIRLEALCDDWLSRWSDARLLKNDCRLVGSSSRTVREAIADLMLMASAPCPPEGTWERLFTACKRAGDRQRAQTAWDLCKSHYHREYGTSPPDDLSSLVGDLVAVDHPDSVPLAVEGRVVARAQPSVGTTPDQDPRLPLIELLGISSASAIHLRGSRLEPSDCIERTQRLLYFSGVLASKWVMEPAVRSEFEQLLYRLDTQDDPGDVRFMVIDPSSEAYERLQQLRGGRISDESVPHLIRLAKKYQCFEVRAFQHLPAFRILAIDDEVVSFSPYALAAEAYKTSRRGWDAPHVILDPQAPWPLAAAFRLYFEEAWARCKPLQEGTLD